jgi:hypothetical protein
MSSFSCYYFKDYSCFSHFVKLFLNTKLLGKLLLLSMFLLILFYQGDGWPSREMGG